MVREQDADVVVLQECLIDGKLPENLIHAFKDKYAHFFIHIGPNGLVPESGLFIMTKYPVHDFSFTRFTDQGGGMTRGFATLKIKTDPSKESPTYAIVGAHMEAGNATEVRKKQLAQIHQAANQMKDVQLVVLAGDTNINIKSSAEVNETQIERVLLGAYKGPVATCTNKFDKQRFPEAKTPDEEWVDQIAVIRREGPQFPENQEGFGIEKVLTEQKVVPAYEDGNSQTALSDHHLLSAIIGS
jgi:endonuclease/exonuclease/phosphatase family metal-dependent hydrolase